MLWLIEANIASTGKPHLRNGTPSRLLNFRALNALPRERSYLGFQIVAHEIEFVEYVDGKFTPLSKPFKTKLQAEKARRKCPERQRKTIAVGVIRTKQ